jgi:Arc/MetJ family transcription regulator
MTRTRTVLDLDGDLLAEAAQALGTGSAAETVDAALREVLAARRHVEALVRTASGPPGPAGVSGGPRSGRPGGGRPPRP